MVLNTVLWKNCCEFLLNTPEVPQINKCSTKTYPFSEVFVTNFLQNKLSRRLDELCMTSRSMLEWNIVTSCDVIQCILNVNVRNQTSKLRVNSICDHEKRKHNKIKTAPNLVYPVSKKPPVRFVDISKILLENLKISKLRLLNVHEKVFTEGIRYCLPLNCVKSLRIRSFSAFGQNTERYSVSQRIQFECGKIRTR